MQKKKMLELNLLAAHLNSSAGESSDPLFNHMERLSLGTLDGN